MTSPPHPVPLLSDPSVHSSGFTPRRIIMEHPPYTDAKLELMGRLRSPPVWRQITTALTTPGPQRTIPPPSRMEGSTWDKFICCSGIRSSETESRALRIRSRGRAPPTDTHGNILPPDGFRRHTGPGLSTPPRSEGTPIPVETKLYSARKFPNKPRKLTLKNRPLCYQEILQKYWELQRGARSIAPFNSRLTTPRTALQVT
ncbi:testis-expressed protein 52 [Dendrobates tinctorius]|uniref:testis-expressed protein 52 n=1 Tax=Dendrobates tinctorius TaxID=92724 RepID=UPI003CC9D309